MPSLFSGTFLQYFNQLQNDLPVALATPDIVKFCLENGLPTAADVQGMDDQCYHDLVGSECLTAAALWCLRARNCDGTSCVWPW